MVVLYFESIVVLLAIRMYDWYMKVEAHNTRIVTTTN